jgi:hypothetical protein
MSWKELPSWLKGGTILLIVYIARLILFVGCTSIFRSEGEGGLICILPLLPEQFILLPLHYFITLFIPKESLISLEASGYYWHITIFYFVMLAIVSFLIGVIIGWIVGKIKKK